MACTIDFRCLDEGLGGQKNKRKRSSETEINDVSMEIDNDNNDDTSAPSAKRQAIPSSENPDKPKYDGIIAGKVSGRKWKQPRKQRSSASKVSLKGTTFEQRAKQKEIKKAYKERMTELKEEIRTNKRKRKQENILKSGTKLQIISNPKTLKKIAKSKQRKQLKLVPDSLVKK
ncbi:hypothetical protein AAG906_023076 [Vitis piasezkii]